jgi:pimeloyl-ACP methyl ester carboxylesterase
MERGRPVKENPGKGPSLSPFQIFVIVAVSLLAAAAIVAIIIASLAFSGVRSIQHAGRSSGNSHIMTTQCVALAGRTDPSTQVVPAGPMFVRTMGKYRPGKPILVLEHGTSASENYWRPAAEYLADRIYVVMGDLRGHGRSVKTPAFSPSNATNTFRYTYELFALDQIAVLAAMGLGDAKIFCGGISIGSSICIELARRYPGRVEGIVLVNGAPLFRCADLTTDGSVSGCAPDQPGDIADWLTGIPTNITTMLPEDTMSAYPSTCDVTAARAKINQNRAVSTAAVQSLVRYAQTTDQTSVLSEVKCPTLIMAGLADITNGIGAANLMHEKIPNSVILEYPGRGHLMPITQGRDIAEEMIKFIFGEYDGVRPERARALDKGCQMTDLVAVESDFTTCA